MPFACGERWEGIHPAVAQPELTLGGLEPRRQRPRARSWSRARQAWSPRWSTSATPATAGTSWSTTAGVGPRCTRTSTRFSSPSGSGSTRASRSPWSATPAGRPVPHLHYEQRLNRVDRHAVFNSHAASRTGPGSRSRNCVDVPVVGDWNGDRCSDVGVVRSRKPRPASSASDAGRDQAGGTFGVPTDTPIVGDWNGDGQTDLGVWRRRTGRSTCVAQLGQADRRSCSASRRRCRWWVTGTATDATTSVSSTRAQSTFLLRDRLGSFSTQVLGTPASLPVAGDWDGDGRYEVGVYDPATTTFTLAMPDGTVGPSSSDNRPACPWSATGTPTPSPTSVSGIPPPAIVLEAARPEPDSRRSASAASAERSHCGSTGQTVADPTEQVR